MHALRELAGHLPDDVVVVDVGCRWGFAPYWDLIQPKITLIGFDADESEVVRLRDEFSEQPHMRFVARTLGSAPGRATLIQTREAGGTSIFRPDRSRLDHLPDYEGARVTAETAVEVSTLDEWMGSDGPDRIDALKLDTQGSELEILRGAVHSLEHTRHVEVEVAFNEMFLDAPLFGSVDAFLRTCGFALWRLRDLVHHALRDAPDPPSVTEHIWYESTAQPVRVRGGQLIWCNAHYVRRDMYDPTSRIAWETRVRDACLTRALAFHDLAILSLERLVGDPDAPVEVGRSAARMLSEILEPPLPIAARQSPLRRWARRAGRARERLRRPADQQAD